MSDDYGNHRNSGQRKIHPMLERHVGDRQDTGGGSEDQEEPGAPEPTHTRFTIASTVPPSKAVRTIADGTTDQSGSAIGHA